MSLRGKWLTFFYSVTKFNTVVSLSTGLTHIGVSELLLIVLLLIPKLLIYLVARRQSKVPISSLAGFLLMKKKINFVAKALKILNIKARYGKN